MTIYGKSKNSTKRGTIHFYMLDMQSNTLYEAYMPVDNISCYPTEIEKHELEFRLCRANLRNTSNISQ